MSRLHIDPVTRLNGQLRIEADVASGTVADAWSSGTMFRGLENVMRGRDPRDVWLLASRICGTCTSVHGLASVRAVERALGVRVPTNARILRNLISSTGLVRDHVLSFYQAQLPDWVDARAALAADPAAAAKLAGTTSDWPTNTTAAMASVQVRLRAVLESDQPGPFATPWSGHAAFALTPEQSLLLMAHALEALDWQRRLMRVHALLGGKDPHPQTFLVGGMALAPPWGGPAARQNRDHPVVPDRNAPNPLSADGLKLLDELLGTATTFVERVYLPDVRLLAAAYPAWGSIGGGTGGYLSWGDLPESDERAAPHFLPAGVLTHANLARALPPDPDRIGESVAHAWYVDEGTSPDLRPPASAVTLPRYDGPLPLEALDGDGRYTWVKAPRYDGEAMETGPLARVLVAAAEGRTWIADPLGRMLTQLGLGAAVLPSVLGRMIARAVEASAVAKRADSWVWELKSNLATGDVAVVDLSMWDQGAWPAEASGWSTGEGPRGAVAHRLAIRDGVIDHYQVVDGSTWNMSPRDAAGTRGPLEAALRGTPVADAERPLELLRVVHSFNPCPACAVHLLDPAAGPLDLRVTTREATR